MSLLPTGRQRRRISLGLGAILIILLFSFPGLAALFISPVAGFFSRAGTGLYDRIFWAHTSRVITSSELEKLYGTLKQYAVDRVDYERLKTENTQLMKQLGFVERTSFKYVAADILAKSLENTISRFVVNVGSEQGIKVGDPVVVNEGILVGKVVEVTARASTIVSITDPAHATAVGLVNEHKTIGIARGTQGGLLSISFIPLEETVMVNDIVVTSGLEMNVPSGLIVGIVNAITQDDTSLFQSAVVEPMADMRRLSSVLILKQEKL